MALVVVAYPELAEGDAKWIETIRTEHDPLSRDIISAHVTLVFGVSGIEQTRFIHHVKEKTASVAPIDFILRCAVLSAPDYEYNCTHVFLVPDEGYSRIVKLHDQLYTSFLRPHLRLDIPYVPHIGVGNDDDPNVCKQLADTLNARNFEIVGRITWLDVARFENMRVETIERIRL